MRGCVAFWAGEPCPYIRGLDYQNATVDCTICRFSLFWLINTKMQLSYDDYLNAVLGGWPGKSMGGAISARFEGHKAWIEIAPDAMFPDTMPPNDDLDLQVLWLGVYFDAVPDEDEPKRATNVAPFRGVGSRVSERTGVRRGCTVRAVVGQDGAPGAGAVLRIRSGFFASYRPDRNLLRVSGAHAHLPRRARRI